MICSISGIVGNGIGYRNIRWVYLLALVLGIIQFFASSNYERKYKKVLVLCFLLEGIYYAVAIIAVLINNINFWEKLFGTIVGTGMLILIMDSMKSLINGN